MTTDEVSLGKAKIVLLPIILGLVIIFFLKLFSIKFPFWIWIVLLIVVIVFALLLTVGSKTSLTSHLPSRTTIFWVVFVVVVVIAIIFVASLLLSSDSRQEISFEDGGSLEIDEWGSPQISGTVIWRNFDMTTKSFDKSFYIGGLEKKENINCTLTLDDGSQKCVIPFAVNYTPTSAGYPGIKVSLMVADERSIMYETQDEGLVFVLIGREQWTVDGKMPEKYFVLSGQEYDAILRIETGRSDRDRIGLKKVKFGLTGLD